MIVFFEQYSSYLYWIKYIFIFKQYSGHFYWITEDGD